MRRVVVTGLGMVSPLSSTVDGTWTKILEGCSGANKITRFNTDGYTTDYACEIKFGDGANDTFNPDDWMEPKDQRKVDYFILYGVAAAEQAIKDSGWMPSTDNGKNRTGVIIGSGIGGLGSIAQTAIQINEKGPRRVSPFFIPGALINLISGQVSIRYGFKGPNHAVSTACSTGAHSIGDATRLIINGDADVMIAGGSESPITQIGIAGFNACRALSTKFSDDPICASRPYDKDRDGFVLAEGAGVMVFEEMEHALARNATIHGEVLGFGATGDAGHITQPAENGEGAAEAMRLAILDSGLEPEKVDYINAHGTSTPLGDKAETVALKKVFGDHAYKLSVSSTKSMLGHSLGASGGIEAVLCVKAIQDNLVPPTANLETPDPDCDLDYTPNEPKSREINVTMSNSFGFGGHNASIMIGRFTP